MAHGQSAIPERVQHCIGEWLELLARAVEQKSHVEIASKRDGTAAVTPDCSKREWARTAPPRRGCVLRSRGGKQVCEQLIHRSGVKSPKRLVAASWIVITDARIELRKMS